MIKPKVSGLKKDLLPLFILLVLVGFLFRPFILQGKIPIPSDNLLAQTHPFRDVVWSNFDAGVPAKNPIVGDPIFQTYPWKKLAIDQIKNGQWPLWNPYTFSGTPLLANFQSSVFNPLNILLIILPFDTGWSFLIAVQPLLAGLFLYYFLKNLGLSRTSSLFGAVSWSFSGVFISWLEWGTYLTSMIWLPLILLSIDKFLASKKVIWLALVSLSLALTIFGGHLQIAFYVYCYSFFYFIFRTFKKKFGHLSLVLLLGFIFSLLISAVQLTPTFEMITLSNRGFDQSYLRLDWFYPLGQLITFMAPDFFGNPARLNYWGVFNYGEFNGYFGIVSLVFALFAVFGLREIKTNKFFVGASIASFLMMIQNPISRIPFVFQVPLLSSGQPSRILSILVFSLIVLTAFGVELFLKGKAGKKLFIVLSFFWLGFVSIWYLIVFQPQIFGKSVDVAFPVYVAQRNFIIPTIILGLISASVFFYQRIKNTRLIIMILFVVTSLDLLRLAINYEPFTPRSWLYPNTKITSYLKENINLGRFISTDRRIFAPNSSITYSLQTMDGYDPVYLKNYAKMITAWQQKNPDSAPGSFNRIIRYQDWQSQLASLYGANYFLSFDEISKPYLKEVEREGSTILYKNAQAFPKAYISRNVIDVGDDQIALEKTLGQENSPEKYTVTQGLGKNYQPAKDLNESIVVESYQPNEVTIKTKTELPAFLVLSDNYYPGWNVYVNDQKGRLVKTNYNQRGTDLPTGNNTVVFRFEPNSFKTGLAVSLLTTVIGILLSLILWKANKRLAS